MSISDISGKVSAIIASPRLNTLEAALQATLSVMNAPVSSRMPRVDKLGESSASRQAVDSPSQPLLKTPHHLIEPGLDPSAPVLTHLSKTAGFLTSLMSNPAHQGFSRASLPAHQPVLDAPPDFPAPLAIGLQAMLEESGLFYESHLLSWYQGQYRKARLKQEPQAQWIKDQATDQSPETAARDTLRASMPSERMAIEAKAISASQADNPASSGSVFRESSGTSGMPSEAARMITQQLLLLDKPSLEWSVNVWPGQNVTLLIEEESPRTAEDQAAWSTQIQLDFPRLGRMEISLKLDALGLRVHLDAENEGMVGPLINQRNQCAARLASTGCKLQEFSIGSRHADA